MKKTKNDEQRTEEELNEVFQRYVKNKPEYLRKLQAFNKYVAMNKKRK